MLTSGITAKAKRINHDSNNSLEAVRISNTKTRFAYCNKVSEFLAALFVPGGVVPKSLASGRVWRRCRAPRSFR